MLVNILLFMFVRNVVSDFSNFDFEYKYFDYRDRYLLCFCFFFDLYVIFILIWNKLMYGDGWMGCYIYYIF